MIAYRHLHDPDCHQSQETVVKNVPEKNYLFDDKAAGEGA